MRSERYLRFSILLLYGVSLFHLVWTGTMYHYIGTMMAPFEVAALVVIWLLIGLSLGSLRTIESPEIERDSWLQGILFAAFALPPAAYLLTAWFL